MNEKISLIIALIERLGGSVTVWRDELESAEAMALKITRPESLNNDVIHLEVIRDGS